MGFFIFSGALRPDLLTLCLKSIVCVLSADEFDTALTGLEFCEAALMLRSISLSPPVGVGEFVVGAGQATSSSPVGSTSGSWKTIVLLLLGETASRGAVWPRSLERSASCASVRGSSVGYM